MARLPSILVGIAAYLILPSSISRARFLSDPERASLLALRHAETGHGSQREDDDEKFHWADVKSGARDWQIWAFALSNFAQDVLLYGHATFLPTIIRGLGRWSAVESQALTAPVYAVAIGVYLFVARCSDRSGPKRGPFVCGFGLAVAGGYAMLLANRGAALSYAGCCVAAAGQYVQGTLSVAWLAGNKPRYGKRAFATGVQISIGNSAGIVAPFLYPNKDAPTYRTGYAVAIAAAFVSLSVSALLSCYYARVNRARARGEEDWKVEGKTEAEIAEMGDGSPRYVYVI
ncbi:hypothetical protein SLS62_004649 [Diatrype stigma]|uniref:Uncharacterized protein n=1 Tax=Diatrype stigma TaxID=117547 RepID=A0AAN9V2L9_9PEZI